MQNVESYCVKKHAITIISNPYVCRMPRKAKVPCGWPGCRELVESGRGPCTKHRKAIFKMDAIVRGSAAERGYDARWNKARTRFLNAHPLCARCERSGRVEAANTVDHIVPVSGPDDPLFWDESNWQSLSTACHNAKTVEDKAKGLTR